MNNSTLTKLVSDREIVVVGSGAWGTALASAASKNLKKVFLYTIDPEIMIDININHKNSRYFGDMMLPNNIVAVNSITEVLVENRMIILVIPAQEVRNFINTLPKDRRYKILVCAKGIENTSKMFISDILDELLVNYRYGILSGPNFAKEVLLGQYSHTVIASKDVEFLEEAQETLQTDNFVITTSKDVIGTQICGAIKNVIAIAAGIILGLELGENAHAALITKGISEISKLVLRLKGDINTVLGPAGAGDLILTCTNISSRNMNFGYRLGTIYREMNCTNPAMNDFGTVNKILKETTVEGYYTTKAIYELSKTLEIRMPVSEMVYHILYGKRDLLDSVKDLLSQKTSTL